MADRRDKQPGQPDGAYYVDAQCIDCDLCRQTAPTNFTRDDEGGYSYVHRQPGDEDEAELCREALEGCPVEAIGDDGSNVEVSSGADKVSGV